MSNDTKGKTRSRVIKQLNQYYERIESSKPDERIDNIERFVLFVALISQNDKRRLCVVPNNYKRVKVKKGILGYDDFKDNVSGPCFTLFCHVLRKGEIDRLEKEPTTVKYNELAEELAYTHKLQKDNNVEYAKMLEKISRNYQSRIDYEYGPDDLIDNLRKRNRDLKRKLNFSDISDDLIKDCYNDLLIRIEAYNYKQANKKTKKDRVTSNIVFNHSSKYSEDAVKRLNKAYEAALSNSDYNTIKEKLEKTMIPLCCINPYACLCIVHKSLLPERIANSSNKEINLRELTQGQFAYAIISTSYVIEGNSYLVTLYPVSHENKNIALVDEIDNIETTLYCYIYTENQHYADNYYPYEENRMVHYVKDNIEIKKRDVCVNDFKAMLYNYKRFCKEEQYDSILKHLKNNREEISQWFPLKVPEEIYEELCPIFNGTINFSASGLIKRPDSDQTKQQSKTCREIEQAGEELYKKQKHSL